MFVPVVWGKSIGGMNTNEMLVPVVWGRTLVPSKLPMFTDTEAMDV